MSPNNDDSITKIRRDHEYMLQLVDRIKGECNQSETLSNCNDCHSGRRPLCHGNIEQLIRAFVETTLKHNFLESMLMEHCVPRDHRRAHNQAHMAIAQQLQDIRVVFSEDGNCVLAIEGIDQIRNSLIAHFTDYDQQLESYLSAVT